MSFYSYKNKGNERSPGLADFEALQCITEKVAVQATKVYDACLLQDSLADAVIPVAALEGTAPYTFISLRNSSQTGTLENVSVTRLQDRPNFARVQADVVIPYQINYSDSVGAEYVGTGSSTVHRDVILYVPDDSIVPYRLESLVGAVSVTGSFTGTPDAQALTADVCISVILKITAQVELLLPAFGFCEIPPCEDFADEACDGFFALPLYPPQMEDVISNNTCLGSSFYNSKVEK